MKKYLYVVLVILLCFNVVGASADDSYWLKDSRIVTVTAYSPRVEECDDTPFIMASNKRVYEGAIAVSRDIIKEYPFGTKVFIRRFFQIFTVEDVMNKRFKNRVDIFFFSTPKAIGFGVKQHIKIHFLNKPIKQKRTPRALYLDITVTYQLNVH